MSISCVAQFDNSNSVVRKMLLEYELGSDGFYQKKEGALVEKVDHVVSLYAFDKKSSNLYVQTETGNYVVVLNKEHAKIYKQSKLAPFIDEEMVDAEVARVNSMLEERYESLNQARTKFLRDSTEKVRLAALEKIRQDSIQKAFQKAVDMKYIQSHNWHDLPMNKQGLECILCGHHVYEDVVYCEGIVNDTIYYVENATGIMGTTFKKLHVSQYNPRLKNEVKYNYHVKLFKDSLTSRSYLSPEYVKAENEKAYTAYAESISTKAPYGYVESTGFDFQEDHLIFDFSYVNSTPKVIKSIDIFCNILDPADNVKKVIKLKAMGPVEMLETKSWTWDDATNKVPDLVTGLRIGKLIVTFKDGRQKILMPKDIVYKQTE
jgi:hypothetical protein